MQVVRCLQAVRERRAAAPVLQNHFGVVARIVAATAAHSELRTDVAKGFVRVTPEISRISLTVLAKFLEQVELGLDVPVLLASGQLHQSLQGAVGVRKLARSLGQLGAWSLRKVVKLLLSPLLLGLGQ